MEKIIYEAGFLLTYALDKLSKTKVLHPIYGAIKEDGTKVLKEIKDISLENSIPKVINLFTLPEDYISCATAIFPAELEDENKKRYSVVVVMAMNYETRNFIRIAQPYNLSL